MSSTSDDDSSDGAAGSLVRPVLVSDAARRELRDSLKDARSWLGNMEIPKIKLEKLRKNCSLCSLIADFWIFLGYVLSWKWRKQLNAVNIWYFLINYNHLQRTRMNHTDPYALTYLNLCRVAWAKFVLQVAGSIQATLPQTWQCDTYHLLIWSLWVVSETPMGRRKEYICMY